MAEKYGMIDGAHHKQWVIDQMVQALLGSADYQRWLEKVNVPGYTSWNQGIAP